MKDKKFYGFIRHLKLPFLPKIAWTLDNGDGKMAGNLFLSTRLEAEHRDSTGKLIKAYDFGSGLVTITLVNDIVSDAVTGSSVVPTLARYAWIDAGTGVTAANEGDTTLQTPWGGARVSLTPGSNITNFQTATTSNHAAIIQFQGTISFTGSFAITEWGLFTASSGGHLGDHKIFGAVNVASGDSITFTYKLTLPSNN